VLVRASVLFVVSSLAFAALESYIHYRTGLGRHWLHCLLGPVHRDALPLLGAFSLVAAAVHGAVAHFFGAVGERAARLVAARIRRPYWAAPDPVALAGSLGSPPATASLESSSARGPPPLVVVVTQ
jgi:hypothetical protein